MRYIHFSPDNRRRLLGIVQGNTIHSLGETTLDDLLARGVDLASWGASRRADAEEFSSAAVTYLPPLARPGKLLCIGLNYADHTKESPYEQPDYPTIFARLNSSLIGHEAPMIRPRISDSLDFEGELAVILGSGGRHISRQQALSCVAGYSIFNDGSVREYQFKSPQWTLGKNFDGTGAFGPMFVTADELPPGGAGLKLETRLNGRVVQSANTSDMLHDVASLISVISEAITLEAGDVIVSGTPAGIGWAREPKLIMRAGDVCEVEIEGLGVLRNVVVDEDTSIQR
ncbi:fumarylacetoacetate hydrolase family protein [Paraburkholderia unamae]|uniref:2-keto-4-pentenoate hydratase/2-oxohepta-3-ene-1,7-dioic acid hydratase in catechol pathway n=1 Tax=Paraburkholderia unamae TaxID=219649 RepID=A0ABX5KLL0_9BURK|nr:fumarylacetoacetate hydrolase family protein [Paraburkholderia unamae]PVX81914.1 2-keto-4-pentenoate hydratase/2-oxohepta-3-ene-1,7-dioic acid hydratase in catechol pathway [Paraburkholderia unamae]RAR62401.1 2-keto-4-pentenoate hydratase/2-oxohepta-3-ene-1,7-dioic acid hydratase in catechol pathway [Paraburkholderia unamae]CAG9258799.1 Fumarylacetoacetate hydrolase family protein [Paraburkholderia unamae]